MTTKTQAEQIGALFNNDGTVFEAADGRDLDAVADEACAYREGFDRQTYVFEDGSSIIVCNSGNGWDYGMSDRDDRENCTCWAECGHSAACDELQRSLAFDAELADGVESHDGTGWQTCDTGEPMRSRDAFEEWLAACYDNIGALALGRYLFRGIEYVAHVDDDGQLYIDEAEPGCGGRHVAYIRLNDSWATWICSDCRKPMRVVGVAPCEP